MPSKVHSPNSKVVAPDELSGPSALDGLVGTLVTDRVTYFPIRHHSPACAQHLEGLIRKWKPSAILIEGPASFTSLIPLILHPKTKAPFAVYTSFVREEPKDQNETAIVSALVGPPRHAAYYPFCDYSPELVALRTGAEVGAALSFIDLDYADQIRAEVDAMTEGGAPRVESLLAERHFERSHYLRALARRAGCRDHNDLWDHFFETRIGQQSVADASVEKFIHDVASWCHFARVDASEEELKADGTLAREGAMAAAIQGELTKGTQRIIV